jgi:holo-[acyl-carrier protein] synthase
VSVVGVGIDAVDVARFARVLERRPTLADRVFTDQERGAVADRASAVEGLAARFAAKEATMKALGSGLGSFALREVEVFTREGSGARRGAPSLRLSGGAAALAAEQQVAHWHLSLTHAGGVALAMVVAEGTPLDNSPADGPAGP